MNRTVAPRYLVVGLALLAILSVPALAQEAPKGNEPPRAEEASKPQEAPKPQENPKPQEAPKPKEAPEPEKPTTVTIPHGGAMGQAGQVDPKKLLKEIARDMAAVEAILLEAGDEKNASESARAAVEKLDKLLGDAKGKQSRVIQQLDKLIDEVRKQQQSKSKSKSKSQGSKPQRPGQSDPQKDPRFDNRGNQPKDQPQRKREPGKKDKTDRKPPEGEKGKTQHPDKAGIWGILPDKVFKLITNREQTVLPAEFREYIEEYFKRLAETKKQP